MRQSEDPTARQAGVILGRFASERRTEAAFYLRFCSLAPMEIDALARHLGIDAQDRWRVFRRVRRFFAL